MWSGFPQAEGDPSAGRVFFSVRSEIPGLAGRLALLCERPDLVALGLTELMLNAIEHGILGIGFERKRQLIEEGVWSGEVDSLSLLPENQGRRAALQYQRVNELMRFSIRDPGQGFDCKPFLELDRMRRGAPNGRGITIARSLCFESLFYRDAGREVEVLALARA